MAGPNSHPRDPARDDAEELELVKAIQGGDTSAWGELLSRYQDRLYTLCLRMIGDREMAADLAHDAMVKVIEGLDSYDGRARLSTWIYRVTMNVCLSKLRSEKHRRHASLDTPRQTPDDSGSPHAREPVARGEPDGLSGVQLREERDLVSRALQRIAPEHRSILVLRDVQGLEYERIAEVLGLAVGTVKSRLFRARAALREAVQEGPGGPGAGQRRGRVDDE